MRTHEEIEKKIAEMIGIESRLIMASETNYSVIPHIYAKVVLTILDDWLKKDGNDNQE